MRTFASYDYATIRVVPRVDREEFLNAGVILFCLERDFLAARVAFNPDRLRALFAEVDLDLMRRHLEAIPRVCEGAPDAGPIAKLTRRERFHWLVAPRSTIIQVSQVHSGISDSPERVLEELFHSLAG